MLTEPSYSAAGPVYPILHYLLAPLTALSAPYVRLVNLVFLILMILMTARILRIQGYGDSLARAGALLAMPIVWVATGMALTELPAAAFAVCAVLLLSLIYVGQPAGQKHSTLHVVACFGLASLATVLSILTRQTYLPLVGVPLLFAVYYQRHIAASALCCAGALILVMPVFYLWGGLTPPGLEQVAGGLNLGHGAIVFGYIAVLAAILAPDFYRIACKPLALGIIVASSLAFAVLFDVRILPMHSLFVSIFGTELADALAILVGAAWVALAAGFGWASLAHLQYRWRDPHYGIHCLIVGGLGGTSIAISHLATSRYSMVAIPFLLVMLQPWFKPTLWASLRLVVGAAMGIVSLAFYLDYL